MKDAGSPKSELEKENARLRRELEKTKAGAPISELEKEIARLRCELEKTEAGEPNSKIAEENVRLRHELKKTRHAYNALMTASNKTVTFIQEQTKAVLSPEGTKWVDGMNVRDYEMRLIMF